MQANQFAPNLKSYELCPNQVLPIIDFEYEFSPHQGTEMDLSKTLDELVTLPRPNGLTFEQEQSDRNRARVIFRIESLKFLNHLSRRMFPRQRQFANSTVFDRCTKSSVVKASMKITCTKKN